MAALRHFSGAFRSAAARSTGAASTSSRIAGLQHRRGYATEATTSGTHDEPAPMMGFKQTTVEELHNQTAHDVLAGASIAMLGLASEGEVSGSESTGS